MTLGVCTGSLSPRCIFVFNFPGFSANQVTSTGTQCAPKQGAEQTVL